MTLASLFRRDTMAKKKNHTPQAGVRGKGTIGQGSLACLAWALRKQRYKLRMEGALPLTSLSMGRKLPRGGGSSGASVRADTHV